MAALQGGSGNGVAGRNGPGIGFEGIYADAQANGEFIHEFVMIIEFIVAAGLLIMACQVIYKICQMIYNLMNRFKRKRNPKKSWEPI